MNPFRRLPGALAFLWVLLLFAWRVGVLEGGRLKVRLKLGLPPNDIPPPNRFASAMSVLAININVQVKMSAKSLKNGVILVAYV